MEIFFSYFKPSIKMTNKANIFEENRKLLEGLSYRMLGSFTDAQDIVQDTFLQFYKTENIINHRAWLIVVCTRLTINYLKSARKKREEYFGVWLPEPNYQIVDFTIDSEIDESISIALLKILELLNPVERAVYILHDIFDFKFDEIAVFINKNSDNCRKIITRARKRILENRRKSNVDVKKHRELILAFSNAAKNGSFENLKAILNDNAVLTADGGGIVEAAIMPIHNSVKIALFFSEIFKKYHLSGDNFVFKETWFNGKPALLIIENLKITSALYFEIYNGKIEQIFSIRNPNKLSLLLTG